MRRFVNVMAALSLVLLMTVLTGCGGLFMSMWEQESSNIVSVWEQEPFTGEDGKARTCTLTFYEGNLRDRVCKLTVTTSTWTETVTGSYEGISSDSYGLVYVTFEDGEINKHPNLKKDSSTIKGRRCGNIEGDTLSFEDNDSPYLADNSPYFNEYTRK